MKNYSMLKKTLCCVLTFLSFQETASSSNPCHLELLTRRDKLSRVAVGLVNNANNTTAFYEGVTSNGSINNAARFYTPGCLFYNVTGCNVLSVTLTKTSDINLFLLSQEVQDLINLATGNNLEKSYKVADTLVHFGSAFLAVFESLDVECQTLIIQGILNDVCKGKKTSFEKVISLVNSDNTIRKNILPSTRSKLNDVRSLTSNDLKVQGKSNLLGHTTVGKEGAPASLDIFGDNFVAGPGSEGKNNITGWTNFDLHQDQLAITFCNPEKNTHGAFVELQFCGICLKESSDIPTMYINKGFFIHPMVDKCNPCDLSMCFKQVCETFQINEKTCTFPSNYI